MFPIEAYSTPSPQTLIRSSFQALANGLVSEDIISDTGIYQHIIDHLHPGQREVYDCPARFRVVACGRRWGKTDEAQAEAIITAKSGKVVWWISPTYKMSTDAWRIVRDSLSGQWKDKSEQERSIYFDNGGILRVWSGDAPDTLRGSGLDLVIIDEAALVSEEVWTASIRPALSDKQGRALFLSTPKGHNWFWRIYALGIDPEKPDWTQFNFPTITAPHMARIPEEIEAAREDMPDRLFRQEYLAEFIEDSGGVFRNVKEASKGKVQEPEDGHVYVAGLDWAKEYDFTCLSVWDKTTRTEVFIDRFNKVDWSLQRGRVKNAHDKYHFKEILAEENSIGGPNIEALQKEGIPVRPFTTTAQSKGELIEGLALDVERGSCTLLNDPVATLEMQSYELERLPSGRFRYGAPEGMHDDTVIARALGDKACNTSGIVMRKNPFYG